MMLGVPDWMAQRLAGLGDAERCAGGGELVVRLPNGRLVRAAVGCNGELAGITDVFESPFWRHRKAIVLGGAGLLGVAALALVGAILR